MSSHTPWKNPPLREALFEVRFPPVDDYAIFVGGMAAALNDKFPTTEKLDFADVPVFIQLEGAVKHRFFNTEKTILFQTGVDVISINVISYSGFDSFQKIIRDVLEHAIKFVSFKKLTRLGVRYINEFDGSRNPFELLNLKPPLPDFEIDKTDEFFLRYVKKEQAGITVNTTVNFSQSEEKALFLDIDAFFTPSDDKWDIDTILEWISKAHDSVYEKFDNLVSQIEKGERK